MSYGDSLIIECHLTEDQLIDLINKIFPSELEIDNVWIYSLFSENLQTYTHENLFVNKE